MVGCLQLSFVQKISDAIRATLVGTWDQIGRAINKGIVGNNEKDVFPWQGSREWIEINKNHPFQGRGSE